MSLPPPLHNPRANRDDGGCPAKDVEAYKCSIPHPCIASMLSKGTRLLIATRREDYRDRRLSCHPNDPVGDDFLDIDQD